MTNSPQDFSKSLVSTDASLPAQQSWLPSTNMWLDSQNEDQGLDVSAFMHSLRRRWLPAALIGTAIATILAVVLFFLIPITYEAVALIRVNTDPRTLLATKSGYTNMNQYEAYKQTQGQLITSPLVLNAALRTLEPKALSIISREPNPLGFLQYEIRSKYSDKSELIVVSMKGDDQEEVIEIVQAVVNAYMDEIANAERMELVTRVNKLKDLERQHGLALKEKVAKIDMLAQEIGTSDSTFAAAKERIEMERFMMAVRKTESIRTYAEEVQTELLKAQSSLQTNNVQPSQYDVNLLLERDPKYFEAKTMLDQLDQQLAYMQSTVRSGPSLGRFAQQRVQLQRMMDQRRKELTPQIVHVLNRELYQRDEIAESQRLNTLQAELNAYVQRYQMAAKESEEQAERVANLTKFSADLEAEKATAEGMRKALDEITSGKTTAEMDLEAGRRIEVVQPAIIPADNSIWMKILQIGGAWTLAFLATILGITGWDYTSKRVNVARDVEKKAGVQVIGSMPNVRTRATLTAEGRRGGITDAIDSIRAAIAYGQMKVQSVVITSAVGQEGKSTVASQLAVSLARSGLKTLLLDGDVRKPSQHAVFGLPADSGLCDVLRNQAELQSVVQATPAEHLWILPAGRCDQVSFQALAGPQMATIMQQLKDQFDFIVVDSGPVLTGPEAMIFGQHVDGAVISTRRDVSELPKVEDAQSRLRSVGIRVLGAVVNGITAESRTRALTVTA